LVLGLCFQPLEGICGFGIVAKFGEYSWICCRFDAGPFDLQLEAQTRCFKSNKMISQTKRRYLTSTSNVNILEAVADEFSPNRSAVTVNQI
jgi:hypothetical protein